MLTDSNQRWSHFATALPLRLWCLLVDVANCDIKAA